MFSDPSYRFDTKTGYLITNPRELIHQERFSPYAPYKTIHNVQTPNKFTQQLRDETMTRTQREANTHADPLNQRDSQTQQKINEIRSRTHNIRLVMIVKYTPLNVEDS
ncbi:hypothetical protein TELCIR_08312 [Teladorsagia circumcincta]|uniref:Uncharacterized protein n=1 Tax=Teladorsagia circumcincta TaxID=45464 RepID=A0A2G9UHX5_TELCI|nr:hypothetical protein TELCIR_08312 [Teladorsagia circumcincta]